METKIFLLEINKLRLKNKDKWYFWQGKVNGKDIQIKAFNTWLQIFRVNGINYSGPMDIGPTVFKQYIEQIISE